MLHGWGRLRRRWGKLRAIQRMMRELQIDQVETLPLLLVRPRAPVPRPRALVLLLETYGLMLLAKVALRLLPSRKILLWQQRASARITDARPSSESDLQQVAWAVAAAARRSPVRLVCFPQALAAGALLRARGIPTKLHYGVTRIDGVLSTHVWLEAAGQIVTGGREAAQFSTLAVF